MDRKFHSTLYNGCNYLSMLGLKFIHISKRGSSELCCCNSWKPTTHVSNTLRPPFCIWHFQMHCHKWKYMNFNKNFTKVCFNVTNDNIPALVQLMVWHQPCEKPFSESTMVSLMMHICVTRPQWFKIAASGWSLTWLLIGCWLCWQQIRYHVRNCC